MLITAAQPQQPVPSPDPPKKGWKSPLGHVKDAVLDAVRASTDYLDDHPVVEDTVATGFAVTRGIQAFPKFVYPSILDATAAERAQIYDGLDMLPLRDVNTVKSITMVDALASDRPGWVINGRAHDHAYTNYVELSRAQLTTPDRHLHTQTHEIGHTKDYESAWFGIFGRHSDADIWGQPPFITDYAKTNPREDFAESFEEYHLNPERLKEVAPDKYEFIRRTEEQGFIEGLIDRPEFRETGRWMGEHLGPSRAGRNAIEAFYFASGFLQAVHGLDQLRKGSETADPSHHFQGVLNLASGTMFATGMLGLPAMGVHAANRALVSAINRGEINAVDADSAVRLVSDPVERVTRFAGSVLGICAPFEDLDDRYPGYDPRTGLAAGIATGGAIGGVAGSLVGPYAGVMAGYHLAGGAGGAAGLVVGALAGYLGGTALGGRAGGAVARALGA